MSDLSPQSGAKADIDQVAVTDIELERALCAALRGLIQEPVAPQQGGRQLVNLEYASPHYRCCPHCCSIRCSNTYWA
jgi:hypothetical protein